MPLPPKRPGTVLFVGVLLIIIGGWSLLGGLCATAPLVGAAIGGDQPPGPVQPGDAGAVHRFFAKEVTGYFPVMFTLMAVNMLLGFGQLLSGIGLFRMNSAARLSAIGLSLVKLLFAFVGHAYNFLLVLPAQKRFFELNPPLPPGQQAPFDIGAFMSAFTFIILGITILIQLTLFAVIVILLSTKGTRDAFAAAASPQADEDDETGGKRRSRYEGYEDDDDFGQSPRRPNSPPETGITGSPD